MASVTKIRAALEEQHFAAVRQSLTAKIREALKPELMEAENAQAKAIEDATRLKTVSESFNADKENFYGKLVNVIETSHQRGFSGFEVVAALDEVLGKVDTIDAKATSVRQYRSFVPQIVRLRWDDEAYAKACANVKDGKGSSVGIDAGGKLKTLAQIGYNAQRALVKYTERGDDETLYDKEVRNLASALKELSKGKAANKETGEVALDPVPVADRLAFVRHVLRMIPKRPVRASAATKAEESNPQDENAEAMREAAGADADDAQDVAQQAKAVNE